MRKRRSWEEKKGFIMLNLFSLKVNVIFFPLIMKTGFGNEIYDPKLNIEQEMKSIIS